MIVHVHVDLSTCTPILKPSCVCMAEQYSHGTQHIRKRILYQCSKHVCCLYYSEWVDQVCVDMSYVVLGEAPLGELLSSTDYTQLIHP